MAWPSYVYLQVEQSMDELLSWINDTERTLNNNARETVGVDPDGVREQLKKAKVCTNLF